MDFRKNVGMLLLSIWLIVSGVVALVPALFFNGLGAIMAILAILAGIFIFMQHKSGLGSFQSHLP